MATGTAITKGAVAIGTAVKTGAVAVGAAVTKGAVTVGTAVWQGAVNIGSAIKTGVPIAIRKIQTAYDYLIYRYGYPIYQAGRFVHDLLDPNPPDSPSYVATGKNF